MLAPLTLGFVGPRDLSRFGDPTRVRKVLRDRLLAAVAQLAAPARAVRIVVGLAEGVDAAVIDLFHDSVHVTGLATGDAVEAAAAAQVAMVEKVGPAFDGTARYVEVARRILDRCDLLIAVLDKDAVIAPGGTLDTVLKARAIGRPVVEICPRL